MKLSTDPAQGAKRRTAAADERPPALRSATDATDAVLMELVGQRQELALRELVNRYGQTVFGLAKRILHDESLAQDIAQDVFVDLWNRSDRFDANRGSMRSLLMSTTHGKSVDLVRNRNARLAREWKFSGNPPNPVLDVDAALMAAMTTSEVRRALRTIPDEEAVAIELAYFGGNTYKQVALMLELPEGTVKTRIRTGLRRLHVLLCATDPR